MSIPTRSSASRFEIRAHKGQKPVVMLTCYHAHTARLLDSHVDDAGGRHAGHGDPRPETAGRHAGDDDPARPPDARRHARWWWWTCRSAVTRIAGNRVPQRLAHYEGNRLPGGETGRRHALGANHPLPFSARYSGGRPYRHDAAECSGPGRQDARLHKPSGRRWKPMPRRWRMRVPSRSFWKPWPNRWRPDHRTNRHSHHRHRRKPRLRRPVLAWRTCWAQPQSAQIRARICPSGPGNGGRRKPMRGTRERRFPG